LGEIEIEQHNGPRYDPHLDLLPLALQSLPPRSGI
jgi:hypothetical protein